MRMLVEPLGMRGPMAAFNGGMVVLPDMTILDERAVPDELTPAVVQTIRDFGLDVWIYRSAPSGMSPIRTPRMSNEKRSTVQFEPTVVPTIEGLLDRVVKIVGVSDDYDLVARCEAAVQHQFGDHVSAARSQPYYLDVTHPTANKGVVVERLSTFYKIPLAQIATLGDQPNDVLMFNRSGVSIAMGNASHEVQRQATHVTDSNEEEGFARAIEEFILPRAVAAPAVASTGEQARPTRDQTAPNVS